MIRRPWLSSLWPGLARLWNRGEWSALILATGFSAVLNVALLSTFVWPEWLGSEFNTVVWPALLVVWMAGWWSAWQQRGELTLSREKAGEPTREVDALAYDRLYIEAQSEYLKGDFDRGRQLLEQQLHRFPRDAASRLLLATLERRTGRLNLAEQHLEQLDRIDQGLAWRFEIRREQEYLGAARAELTEQQAAESVQIEGSIVSSEGSLRQDWEQEHEEVAVLQALQVQQGHAASAPNHSEMVRHLPQSGGKSMSGHRAA